MEQSNQHSIYIQNTGTIHFYNTGNVYGNETSSNSLYNSNDISNPNSLHNSFHNSLKETKEIKYVKEMKEMKETKENKEMKENKKEYVEKKEYEKTIQFLKDQISKLESSLKEMKSQMNKTKLERKHNQKQKSKDNLKISEIQSQSTTQNEPINDIKDDISKINQKVEILMKKSELEKLKVKDYASIDYRSILQQWTSKNRFRIIYDTDYEELSFRTLNSKIKGMKDVMFIIETENGSCFGSYTATKIPHIRREETNTFLGKDPGFFVFTLRNPYNIQPMKFTKKDNTKTIMYWQQPNEFDAIISAILCYRISERFEVKIMNQFKDFYEDPTGLGDDIFTGNHEPESNGVKRFIVVKCD